MENTLPTVYVSSEGKEIVITEMNPFQLVNGLLKLNGHLTLNPNGIGSSADGSVEAEYAGQKAMAAALKAEVLRRLDTRKGV